MTLAYICIRCGGDLEKPRIFRPTGNVCQACQKKYAKRVIIQKDTTSVDRRQKEKRQVKNVIRRMILTHNINNKVGNKLIPKTLIEYRKEILRKIDELI